MEEIIREKDIVLNSSFSSLYNLEKIRDLEYGENTHQRASVYKNKNMADYEVLFGKELSYNNIINITEVMKIICEFYDVNAVAVVKHTKPCGVALGRTLYDAYTKAFDCDPISCYSGTFGFSRPVDYDIAKHINSMDVEVIIAPDFDEKAFTLFSENPEIKLVKLNTKLQDYRKLIDEEINITPFGTLIQDANKSLLKSSKNDMNKNKFDDSLSIPSLNSGSNIDTELNQPNSNTGSIKDQMSSSENESGEIIDEDDNIEIRHSESALEGQLSEGEVISTDYSDNILIMKYEKAKEENQNLKDKIESMQGEIKELSAHLQDIITMQLHSTIEELDEVRASNQELKQRSLNLELLQEENSFLRHRVMSLESRESEL